MPAEQNCGEGAREQGGEGGREGGLRLRRDGKECRLRSSKVCLAGSFEEVDHLRTVMPILTMIGSVQQALQFLVFWPAIPAISR